MVSYFARRGADISTLTTHDAVHGLGAKWDAAKQKKNGFGYGPPLGDACIRAITKSGATSLFYFFTQHPDGEQVRVELREVFGPDWRTKCFGRARYFISHSWGMRLDGMRQILKPLPPGSFVWNDIIAINQHGDAGPDALAAMREDLGALDAVVVHFKHVLLYFDPWTGAAPLQRVWCLYELLGGVLHSPR